MRVVYVDMDGVLADYDSMIPVTTEDQRREKGFFEDLAPMEGAVDAFKDLCQHYDVYILSTAPWSNIHAPSEKRIWVEKHLGDAVFKRLILSHNKGLLRGDYLIDDRIANGVDSFPGEHIHFGTERFPDWKAVMEYLLRQKQRANPSPTKEVVNIVANFLSSNRDMVLLDQWTMTDEAAKKLSALLSSNGY